VKNITDSTAHGTLTREETGTPNSVHRREFLELASLSSAALLFAGKFAQAAPDDGQEAEAGAALATHAAFHSLAAGDVRAGGWLHLYLEKQAQQLGSHLPEVSWPFTAPYWAGEEAPGPNGGGWGPWEQMGYWIDGALRCALILQDENLLRRVLVPLDYTLSHVLPDGYLGPAFAREAKEPNPAKNSYRWPHTVFFRALAAQGEATRDSRIPAAMRRHYLADREPARYGGPSRDVTNVEGMLWAYERTGDKQLLAMAELAWQDFLRSAPPGDRVSGDLHPDRVFANTPIHSHGCTYIEKAKLPVILYMYTGNSEYLRYALAAQERIFTHHMLIDGIPSTSEIYRETSSVESHETCDISDHTWSWGYLLMATGDGLWADRIERACFNAGLGAIKKDWKGLQYFSCPNQAIATENSSYAHYAEGYEFWPEGLMAYRPNPGRNIACCAGNVHRFFPNYVTRMWMTDGKGGLAAMLYGASTLRTQVGSDRQPIEFHQETDYPFDETIHLIFRSSKPVTFPLSLRIPAWCKTPRLALNGETLAMPAVHKGFVRLERAFRPGDRVTLTLPMQTELSYWPNNGVGLEHGPLVFALPVKEDWSSVVTPKYSTPEFPEWNAKPSSAWNYGVGVEETELIAHAQIERKPMTEDPWIDPPVSLTVPMKRIPGWELVSDPQHPGRKLTPPLPELDEELSKSLKSVQVERIALTPYGATQLRITVFPNAVTKWYA
jgi:uncharacterized protein